MSVITLPFSVSERVRWSDCDPLGIVYYGAYLRFFEIAEFEMLRAAGAPYDMLRLESGVWLPRKALHAEFHRPAAMDEEINVGAGVERLGDTSLTFRFEVTRALDGARRASATLTVVCVEREPLAKRAIPEWFRAALAPFVIPAEPPPSGV